LKKCLPQRNPFMATSPTTSMLDRKKFKLYRCQYDKNSFQG